MNQNWGACQAQGQECSLNFNLPTEPTYYALPNTCYQGSVPNYYINVKQVSDVQAGLSFATKYGVPLVVKNSGAYLRPEMVGLSCTCADCNSYRT